MIAVTYKGPNNDGAPEDFPVLCRENAEALLPGESALMTLEDYRSHKAAKDAEWQAPMPVDYVTDIRAEAQRRIVAMLGYTVDQRDQWTAKQINMTAKGAQLARKEYLGTITPEESATLAALEGFFAKVEAIRTFSNDLEAAWAGGQRPDIYAGWPY